MAIIYQKEISITAKMNIVKGILIILGLILSVATFLLALTVILGGLYLAIGILLPVPEASFGDLFYSHASLFISIYFAESTDNERILLQKSIRRGSCYQRR